MGTIFIDKCFIIDKLEKDGFIVTTEMVHWAERELYGTFGSGRHIGQNYMRKDDYDEVLEYFRKNINSNILESMSRWITNDINDHTYYFRKDFSSEQTIDILLKLGIKTDLIEFKAVIKKLLIMNLDYSSTCEGDSYRIMGPMVLYIRNYYEYTNQKDDHNIKSEKTKVLDNYYWEDGNKNKWSVDKYTKDEAFEFSKTLVNCGCSINCFNSKNLWDCKDCKDCKDCIRRGY